MIRHLLVLPGIGQISSGTDAPWAIRSIRLTQSVNSAQALTLGSVCTAALEAELWAAEALPIAPGQELLLYQQEGQKTTLLGHFLAEKPTRIGAQTYRLVAYDRVRLLDRELSQWLRGLENWPYPLQTLADMVCQACGLERQSGEIPNGSYPVEKFTADGVTGRQLMSWIGQVAGRFCRATAEGKLELGWYVPDPNYALGIQKIEGIRRYFSDQTLSLDSRRLKAQYLPGHLALEGEGVQVQESDGTVNLEIAQARTVLPCMQGGIQFEDYTVSPIEKVQLRRSQEDIGTVWPDIGEGNTYCITGNPLLSAHSAQALLPVAQTLFEQLKNVSYTPCKVLLWAAGPAPGQILEVQDREGIWRTAYIMSRVRSGQQEVLESTGAAERRNDLAVNDQSFQSLSGKVLNLRTDVDGIQAENRDAAGHFARLELDLEGIRSQVARQEGKLTQVEQTAQGVQVTVGTVAQALDGITQKGAAKVATGMGYTLDDRGLRIQKSGREMENLLDETGMYVKRGDAVILRANNQGVAARDVCVENFLVVGNFARFEDYSNGSDISRTACFYIGGQ